MNIEIKLEEECPECMGTGEDIRYVGKCTGCNGKGMILTNSGRAILFLVKKHLARLQRELEEESKA